MTGKNETVSENGPFEYNPNVAMSYVMAIIWVAAAAYLVFQYFKHKSWFFWCMVVGGLMEAIGFVCRIWAVKDRHKDGVPIAYIISWTLTLLAPSFLAAACYMAFGRLIYYVTPVPRRNFRNLWVPARFITPVFVVLDILSFLIMALGGARVSSAITQMNSVDGDKIEAAKVMESGYNIAKTGVIVQLVCFGFFTFVGARILFVAGTWRSQWPDTGRWRRLAWAINAACGLILFRSIFRLVEFMGGDASKFIMEHEVFIYVFDAYPMLFVLFIFFHVPPATHLPRLFMSVRYKKHLREQEKLSSANDGEPMGSYGYIPDGRESETALHQPLKPLQPYR